MLRTETVSQEFALAAIVVMLAVILLALLGVSLHALALPAGVGVAFWLAGMWCDLRGV